MMKIDSRFVGKVIGPRGATIKELQCQHNVRISISKEDDQNGMREAKFEGDELNIQSAMSELNRRFLQGNGNEYSSNRRFDYNRGSYGGQMQYQSNTRNCIYSRGHNYEQRENRNYNNKYSGNADDNFDKPTSVVSYSNRNRNFDNSIQEGEFDNNSGVDWGKAEMEANFQPSLNSYSSSSTSNVDWNKESSGCSQPYNRPSSNLKFNRPRINFGRVSYGNSTSNSNQHSSADKTTARTDIELIDWDKANEICEAARKERWAKCPLMLKNFYKEHPVVSEMTQEEVERFRAENNNIQVCHVFDETVPQHLMPKPTAKFEYAFEAYPELLEQIKQQGFENPSPIQAQMWPILLSGEDCIGISQTGSGKTLAFLLPALIHIDCQPHPRGIEARGGPNVLVLAPTRELAMQIEKEVAKYQYRGIRAVCLYGGNDRKKQIEVVESGVEIIIATPGRLNDLVAGGYIKVESITYLVLDEGDRMLDMGFEPQIRKILLDIREDRQTVMTSATWPAGVRRLASSYMKNPYQVVIGSLDLAAVHSVTQKIEMINEDDKQDRIFQFVQTEMGLNDKAIIFCGKKDRADHLSCEFALKKISCQAIHGNREQCDREQALEDIKQGVVKILIATDVASRGIDIGDITHVINYDFPRNIEEYVHRVGRTGRAGRTGISLSFMTRSDWGSAKELIDILKEANQEIPEELYGMAERFEAKKARGGSFGGRGNFQSRGGHGRGWH